MSSVNSVSLDSPLKLPCGAELPNRLAKAAMTEGLADEHNQATERHVNLYRQWGKGGCGMLLTGNVQVDRRYLERAGNIAIEGRQGDNALAGLKAVAAASKEGGAAIWMQISHAGRQTPAAVNKEPVAPSAVPLPLPRSMYGAPRALTEAEIEDTIARFLHVGKMAKETGFDGVQLHGAHGYLVSEFLSPLVNRREDKWGGSLENRARLGLEIIRGWRKALGKEFAIGVKMNSADFQRGGFDEEDSRKVAQMFEREGVDLIEISGGSYERPMMIGGQPNKKDEQRRESTIAREAYFLSYAEEIRKAVKIPLMVTGGFRTRAGMEAALKSGAADVIGIGRPLCADPAVAGEVLRGEVETMKSWEHQLQLGPGWLLGPNSPISLVRALNGLGQISWFYQQLYRMGDGEVPNKQLGVFSSFRNNNKKEARKAAALVR